MCGMKKETKIQSSKLSTIQTGRMDNTEPIRAGVQQTRANVKMSLQRRHEPKLLVVLHAGLDVAAL